MDVLGRALAFAFGWVAAVQEEVQTVEGYKSVPDVSLVMIRGEVVSLCQSLCALQSANLRAGSRMSSSRCWISLAPARASADPAKRRHAC